MSANKQQPSKGFKKPTPFPASRRAHGNGGGGSFLAAYDSLQEQIASYGFVVAAFASCWFDSACDQGESQWLETVKTIQYLEENNTVGAISSIDFSKPFSVSGHSTGARDALMLAAIRDTPAYLASDPKLSALLTPAVRAIIDRIQCVVADHPDPMLGPRSARQNPDIPHWNVTSTPVMVVTGSFDYIEPRLSAWLDFASMSTPNKLYLNIRRATHMYARSPIIGHPEGPWIAHYLRYYLLGDRESAGLLFGNQTKSLQNTPGLVETNKSARNQGQTEVGFLACRQGAPPVPAAFARWC